MKAHEIAGHGHRIREALGLCKVMADPDPCPALLSPAPGQGSTGQEGLTTTPATRSSGGRKAASAAEKPGPVRDPSASKKSA